MICEPKKEGFEPIETYHVEATMQAMDDKSYEYLLSNAEPP